MVNTFSFVVRSLWQVAILAMLIPIGGLAQTAPKAPIKVGIIGLDTSHVIAFTRALNDPSSRDYIPGFRVVAAYKGGSPDVRVSWSRVDKFTAEVREKWHVKIVKDIPTLCSMVDVVLLESVDGRKYLEQVKPVFAAHKRVFIDKPLAGSYKDAKEIYELGKAAHDPWFTASSLRYWSETQRLAYPEGIGRVLTYDVLGPTSREPYVPSLFFYGVHAVEVLYQLMGPGCDTVSMQTSGNEDVVVGKWKDGRLGVMRGFSSGLYHFSITVYGTKGILHSEGTPDYYAGLLKQITTFFKTGVPPIDPRESLETLAFMEAADLSRARGGAPVPLSAVMK